MFPPTFFADKSYAHAKSGGEFAGQNSRVMPLAALRCTTFILHRGQGPLSELVSVEIAGAYDLVNADHLIFFCKI